MSSISTPLHSFWGLVATTFRSIRHRNYRLFFFGQLISLIGTWLQNTAQTWLVYTLTPDERILGLITFLGSVPVLFLSIMAGTMADEYPKRRILVYTQTAMGVCAFALFYLAYLKVVSVWMVGAISLFTGIAVAFDLPTRQAFVVELVGKEDLTNAVALNSAIFNTARLLGPALGAGIIAIFSMETCFFLNSISFIAVIIGLLMMRFEKEPVRIRTYESSRLNAMKEGLHYLNSIPHFRALMILVIAMTLFGWSYTVNLPVIAAEILKGDSTTYGVLLSSNGIGALLAALTQAAWAGRFEPRKMLFVGIGVFIVGSIGMSFTSSIMVMSLSLVAAGWGIITFFITANTTLQRRVPDELRGRVMGIYSLSFAGLFPFGSLFAGFLAHEFSVQVALLMSAGFLLLISVPTYRFIQKLPRLQTNAIIEATNEVQAEALANQAEQIAKS